MARKKKVTITPVSAACFQFSEDLRAAKVAVTRLLSSYEHALALNGGNPDGPAVAEYYGLGGNLYDKLGDFHYEVVMLCDQFRNYDHKGKDKFSPAGKQ